MGGQAGVPANAAAVVMNVTVTNPAGPGFVTVWPCGAAATAGVEPQLRRPARTSRTSTISRLGTGGQGLPLLDDGDRSHRRRGRLLPGRLGLHADRQPDPHPRHPQRHRRHRRCPPTASLQLPVGGQAGVPGNAAAVVMNVTVTNPAAAGFVTVWPCGAAQPLASNLNYVAGQNVPNLTISQLGAGGKVCFYSMVATDLVADVAGFFPAGSDYTPIDNPTRILDTRNGTGTGGGGGRRWRWRRRRWRRPPVSPGGGTCQFASRRHPGPAGVLRDLRRARRQRWPLGRPRARAVGRQPPGLSTTASPGRQRHGSPPPRWSGCGNDSAPGAAAARRPDLQRPDDRGGQRRRRRGAAWRRTRSSRSTSPAAPARSSST